MIIEITSGADAGRTANFRSDQFTVGREGTTNLVLRDAKASRRHATLREMPDGRVELTDLGSRNGTFVNGHQVTGTVVLNGNEEIRIGDTVMRLAREEAPAPGAAAAVPPPPPGQAAPPPVPGQPHVPPVPAQQPPPPIAPPFQAPANRPVVTQSAAPPPPGPSASTMQRLVIQRGLKRVTIIGVAVLVLLVVAIGGLVTGIFGGDDDTTLTNAEVVEKFKPGTLLVVNEKFNGGGRGSGWVWDAKEGYIVTNAHVATGADKLTVSIGDKLSIAADTGFEVEGDNAREAELVGEALCEDIAVLKVDDTEGLRTVPRVPSQDKLKVGEDVIVIGYPATLNLTEGQPVQDADLTGTAGVISQPRTTLPEIPGEGPGDPAVGPYRDAILTDAVINGGNSGGPLVNREGKVVGISSAERRGVQGQFYAVGIDRVNSVVPQLIEGEDVC